MKKNNIVKENRDFTKIIEKGKYINNKNIIIYYMNNNLNKNRYGITISKKNCIAVVRNKIKRQFKNIIDKNEKLFPKDKDYIIILKKSILELNFFEKEKELLNLINSDKWR